jgi:hypothetical protein
VGRATGRYPTPGKTVAAQGGAIEVQRVRPEGAGNVAAAEFAGSAGLKVGSKLGA